MKVVFLNPQGEARYEREGKELAPRLEGLSHKTLGILDDGFGGTVPDTIRRLGEMAEERFEGVGIIHRMKPNLGSPSPVGLIDELARTCDAVIVGVCA